MKRDGEEVGTVDAPSPDPPRPGTAGAELLDTYRFVRFGILAAVFMLAMSIAYEVGTVDTCWQTSISAYYYTPVRSIFVGALIAIGCCLIVIKGRTDWEDIFLNLAGMMAPVVALVPTADAGRCSSVPITEMPTVGQGDDEKLAAFVVANVQNNTFALLAMGVAAIVVVLVFAAAARRPLAMVRGAAMATPAKKFTLSAIITVALVAVGWWLLGTWSGRATGSHFAAAGSMFACFGVVVVINAVRSRGTTYRPLYASIAVAMVLALAVLIPGFDHEILWLEIIEIALFATFWIAQTVQWWNDPGSHAAA